MSGRGRTALWIGVAAFLFYAITGGGRIVGSDEVTMLELSRAMLHGHIDVPEGATLQGKDGRFYTKNMPAQAVLALPLVAIAETATRAAGLPDEKQTLALRFFVSFFNAIVTAILLAAFYAFARELGIGVGAALGTTAMLGLTTPLWVYAKSFMAEPLEGLGLLLALWGSYRAADNRRWPWLATFGFLLATLSKLSVSLLALFCVIPLVQENWKRGLLIIFVLIASTVGLTGLYDWARFRDLFQTGYGAQASRSGFTTPLLVGIYGLLFSSGKGLCWFAPGVWLYRSGGDRLAEIMRSAPMPLRRNLAGLALSVLATGLSAVIIVYGRFEHWAGDGSFGPRYLLPILPLVFLVVAFAIQYGRRWRFGDVLPLLVLGGLAVQIGGVAIHYGAEMREVGDYPYTRALNDPRFMSESHFDPHQSPIAIHWRMLLRNAGEHLRGQAPRLETVGGTDERVGVSAADQQRLLHGLDFWWLYMSYAGLPALPIGLALGALLALLVWAALRLRAAALHEARAG